MGRRRKVFFFFSGYKMTSFPCEGVFRLPEGDPIRMLKCSHVARIRRLLSTSKEERKHILFFAYFVPFASFMCGNILTLRSFIRIQFALQFHCFVGHTCNVWHPVCSNSLTLFYSWNLGDARVVNSASVIVCDDDEDKSRWMIVNHSMRSSAGVRRCVHILVGGCTFVTLIPGLIHPTTFCLPAFIL